jgi:hypothetical protein
MRLGAPFAAIGVALPNMEAAVAEAIAFPLTGAFTAAALATAFTGAFPTFVVVFFLAVTNNKPRSFSDICLSQPKFRLKKVRECIKENQ